MGKKIRLKSLGYRTAEGDPALWTHGCIYRAGMTLRR
jgi:hypothetical protein